MQRIRIADSEIFNKFYNFYKCDLKNRQKDYETCIRNHPI